MSDRDPINAEHEAVGVYLAIVAAKWDAVPDWKLYERYQRAEKVAYRRVLFEQRLTALAALPSGREQETP